MPRASDLQALQERLGYRFRDEGLLRLALTHPSVAQEAPGTTDDNQRLEYLGDAILSAVLARRLYETYPQLGEGPLTKARAQLVNKQSLAAESRQLGLGQYLRLSHGEEASGGRDRPSALADAYEALIGAVFLDGDYAAAEEYILRTFAGALATVEQAPQIKNPKGELQEILQSRSPAAPSYQVICMSGPDHDRVFECAVLHQGVELARGRGKSKKEAESQAALAALLTLQEPDAPGTAGA
ncbi:MAG: ribonuclease [Verrucomicrobiota bacterium]